MGGVLVGDQHSCHKRSLVAVLCAFLLLWVSFAAFAAPASWYKWKSKIKDAEVCSQTSPGEGWERTAGPYRDGRCEKLKNE
jgi:hypothetical protein